MRRWILLFAIVFVFSVLSNVGQTQVERRLADRVAELEGKVSQLECKFDSVVAIQIQRTEADYDRLNRSEARRRRMLDKKKEWIEQDKQSRISQSYSRRQSFGGGCY